MSSAGQMGERCTERFQIDSGTLSMALSAFLQEIINTVQMPFSVQFHKFYIIG